MKTTRKELLLMIESLRDAIVDTFTEEKKTETPLDRLARINTYEDACKELGWSAELPDLSMLPKKHRKHVIAYIKLTALAEAVRLHDPKITSERLYWVWFNVPDGASAGLALSYATYAPSDTSAYIGGRLCFFERETAIKFGNKFISIYSDLLLIK